MPSPPRASRAGGRGEESALSLRSRFEIQTARASELQTRVIAPLHSGSGRPVYSCLPLPPEGRAERLAFHRARGARSAGTQPAHLAPCAYSTGQPLLVRANGGATFPFRLRKAARPGSRYFACVPHAMDFAACCMSQEASLLPTLSRSCELSPGHALGPSARIVGICPPAP